MNKCMIFFHLGLPATAVNFLNLGSCLLDESVGFLAYRIGIEPNGDGFGRR